MVIMFGRETVASLPLGWDVISYLKQPALNDVGHDVRSKESLLEGDRGGGPTWPWPGLEWMVDSQNGYVALLDLGMVTIWQDPKQTMI